jgi:hypothetical protein
MNDGIYYPLAEERFAKYREGIQNLVDKARAARSRIILLTPPPFDAVPVKGQTLPAGLAEYRQPFEGYDEVLGRYSKWLLQQRKHGWQVIDIHTPINKYLSFQRKTNPDFRLAGDGVHINLLGHWLIAEQILAFLGPAAPQPAIMADASTNRLRGISGTVESHADSIQVSFHAPVPMPLDPALDFTVEKRSEILARYDQTLLKVGNANAGEYRVSINGLDSGGYTSKQLEDGIPLTLVIEALGKAQADKLLTLVHAERAMLTDAWLNYVGHKRPGMAQGKQIDLAIEDARKQAVEIKALAAPIKLTIELRRVTQ